MPPRNQYSFYIQRHGPQFTTARSALEYLAEWFEQHPERDEDSQCIVNGQSLRASDILRLAFDALDDHGQ